jgi:hypothetical protein
VILPSETEGRIYVLGECGDPLFMDNVFSGCFLYLFAYLANVMRTMKIYQTLVPVIVIIRLAQISYKSGAISKNLDPEYIYQKWK